MEDLIKDVESWAYDKGLFASSSSSKQFLKLSSEFGELCMSILDDQDTEDDIGDMMVVSVILARLEGYDITKMVNNNAYPVYGTIKQVVLKCGYLVGEIGDAIFKGRGFESQLEMLIANLSFLATLHNSTLKDCLTVAYSEISDRKGVNLDGAFIKETDPDYEGALAVLAARRVHEKV